MPKVIQDFLGVAAIVGALTMFFVFASNHWIQSMEAQVLSLQQDSQTKKEKIARMEVVVQEIRSRLERIESKLDRAIHDPSTR